MLEPTTPEGTTTGILNEATGEAAEWYERGVALKKAGLFKRAIDQFERAAADSQYALKAYAQIGLCHKSIRQYEQAVTSFRRALKSPTASARETVQLLYVLGRTLESLGRADDALEAYRWLRREDPGFRDVAERIGALSVRKPSDPTDRSRRGNPWAKQALQVWEGFLRHTR
ncbi:conserved protein of unknown function [Nitrospira japonica]|uniref:Uncharacterized protein n=1 Tax=Nitrospira japonica TaxID=1325564 RepID=A0A1W1I9D2_9BACT|nr:tetratricopeptide repeat protein [Nitrospira japonica]SLM49624.1 conserved protein of unknown function [Nitrospira japonica]